MRKSVLTILILFLAASSLFAQNAFIHRNIGLDSLMGIMQRTSKEKIYYTSDATSKNLTFTINTMSPTLLEDIKGELQEKGFIISKTEGYTFVLKGIAIREALPENWYAEENPAKKQQEQNPVYAELLGTDQQLAMLQNKVYQIGDKNNRKASGKAYLSGYVRDSRTGEPVIGVNIFNSTSQTYAQSDAAGLYKILLPVGETSLDVSGYSLEDMKVHLQVLVLDMNF